MDWLVTLTVVVASGVGINMLSSDLYDRFPSLARWIISRAARRLPLAIRERYSEEWLAHAEQCEGHLEQVCHALQCWIGAGALARVRHPQKAAAPAIITFQFGSDATGRRVKADVPTFVFMLDALARAKALPPSLEGLRLDLSKMLGPSAGPNHDQLGQIASAMDEFLSANEDETEVRVGIEPADEVGVSAPHSDSEIAFTFAFKAGADLQDESGGPTMEEPSN